MPRTGRRVKRANLGSGQSKRRGWVKPTTVVALGDLLASRGKRVLMLGYGIRTVRLPAGLAMIRTASNTACLTCFQHQGKYPKDCPHN